MASTGIAPETLDPLLALERMDQAFYAIGRDWRFRYVNAAAEAFWGRPRAALLGHSMLELFPKFEGSPSYEAHRRAMTTMEPTRADVISTATGAPVEIRLYPSDDGLSVYFTDVTQRQRLEQELNTRDELLSLAELSAGIGVWVQDLRTATMTATPQFFRLLGIEPIEGAVSQDFIRGFRHPDDRDALTDKFREALSSGRDIFEGEYRIRRPNGDERWIFGRGRISRDREGRPWRYSGVDIDVTDRKEQEKHLHVVMGELLHRTNNLMTVVQSLAQQTATGSHALSDFVPAFTARLQGLSRSNALLARAEWRGAPLDELIRAQASILAGPERFVLEGPPVLVSPRAVQNIGLALHELCTNATKYGALSVPDGRVHIHWTREADRLCLSWVEEGGPPVVPPTRKGFGRVVAEQNLAAALNAEVETRFAPDGLRWTARLPPEEFEM